MIPAVVAATAVEADVAAVGPTVGVVAAGAEAAVVVAVLAVEAADFWLKLWKTLVNGSDDVGSGDRNVGLVALWIDDDEAACRFATSAGLVLIGVRVTTECELILIRQLPRISRAVRNRLKTGRQMGPQPGKFLPLRQIPGAA